MAKAYRKEDFDYIMSKVGKVNPRVKEYLEEAGYDKWSRCHSPINRGRTMTSNIAECINGCLVDVIVLPILGFLEEVRILFAAWNCKNSEIASYTNTTLWRRFQEILTDNGVKSLRMTVKIAGSYLYCVYELGRRYIVDIDRGMCNYYRYQIDEILCVHTIVILKSINIDVKEYGRYCSELYRPNTIVKTYELPTVPMPDMKDWIVPESVDAEEVLPPKYKRPPGRSKKGRHLKSSESLTVSSNHCGKCGRAGHNRKTCGFFPKES
ncbi:uncharacterized protein LOC107874425 [Capsicum annuum]|uniref:uncharacterized protein LOC107874425 n=1 Tax=Capsicum annuum TaxID=4072 RepID=UPI0007BF755B|nr:uncharacterized protein LOC107874425 [Capsicum annuum]